MYLKIAICDDDQLAIDEIMKYLKKYPEAEIQSFTTAAEVIKNNTKFDVAFLDIEIGRDSGFDLARHIYNNNNECIISFFSIHSEYAVKGYSYNIFRYILKSLSTT